jgi:hypothetical protein
MRRSEYKAPVAVLRAALQKGASYAAIARRDGVSDDAVRMRAVGLGLRASRKNGRLSDERILKFGLSVADVPVARLAACWGVDVEHLYTAARRLGLPTDPAGREALRASRQRQEWLS